MVPELRAIYRAQDAEAGLAALEAFEAGPRDATYPAIVPAWRRNWDRVIPFFAFEAVRRIVYTTNSIEALNSKRRRAARARGHFPNDGGGHQAAIPRP